MFAGRTGALRRWDRDFRGTGTFAVGHQYFSDPVPTGLGGRIGHNVSIGPLPALCFYRVRSTDLAGGNLPAGRLGGNILTLVHVVFSFFVFVRNSLNWATRRTLDVRNPYCCGLLSTASGPGTHRRA